MPEIIKTALQDLLAMYFDLQITKQCLRLSLSGNPSGYTLSLIELTAPNEPQGAHFLADVWAKTDDPQDASIIAMRLTEIKFIETKLIELTQWNQHE